MKCIVCLRDKVAGDFMTPFFVPSLGVAYRMLMDEIKRGGEGNMLASHPGDFEVYQLGTFDEGTGLIDVSEVPVHLMQLQSLVEKE